MKSKVAVITMIFSLILSGVWAEGTSKSLEELVKDVDLVWLLVASFLVFFMQAGFGMVETGLTRSKNACNLTMKNTLDFATASIGFFCVGFALMYGTDNFGMFGTGNYFLSDVDPTTDGGLRMYAYWLFQCMFCGAAATIVAGAAAERTKFKAYLAYSVLISTVIYPISGHWIWGGGWLSKLSTPFLDFAGSTVVHSVGGWLALAAAIVLGPRIGKYGPDGKSKAIPGHNIPLVSLGVFILWFGWFGFNPGSTLTAGPKIGLIALTTNMAAAAGTLTAMITSWIRFSKPETTMTLNGALAGLVAITAGCANVSPMSSIIIGGIAGVLVVLAVEFVDKVLKIDDPVGAFGVHGVNGVFGTFAVGLFAQKEYGGIDGLFFGGGMSLLVSQIIGIIAVAIWAFGLGMILFKVIKHTIGLRVSKEEEIRGLDLEEHGLEAYSGFQIYTVE